MQKRCDPAREQPNQRTECRHPCNHFADAQAEHVTHAQNEQPGWCHESKINDYKNNYHYDIQFFSLTVLVTDNDFRLLLMKIVQH